MKGWKCYKSNEMDWQAWYKKTDNTAFDFSQNPLVKFCVIAGENTETLNKNEILPGVAANIRGEIVSEPNNRMGNFVTGISTKAYYVPTNDLLSNARAITAARNDQLKIY